MTQPANQATERIERLAEELEDARRAWADLVDDLSLAAVARELRLSRKAIAARAKQSAGGQGIALYRLARLLGDVQAVRRGVSRRPSADWASVSRADDLRDGAAAPRAL